MTLIGKITTVLIFLVTSTFLFLSVMVYATHRNWKEEIIKTGKTVKELGLKPRLEFEQQKNIKLRQDINSTRDSLAREKAARRAVVAALQTRLLQQKQLVAQKESELSALQSTHTAAVNEVTRAQDLLAKLTKNVEDLRADIRDTQVDRDEQSNQVVTLTNDLFQLESQQFELIERRNELIAEVNRIKAVMDRVGVTKNTNVDGATPTLYGTISEVSAKEPNIIVVTIGSDQGLRIGDVLHVYDETSYLGRAIVKEVSPHESIAEIEKKYKDNIREGKRVTTKFGSSVS